MKLANLKGFECLVNDFVNTGGERFGEEERQSERKAGGKEGEMEEKKKGQGADIKIPRVV